MTPEAIVGTAKAEGLHLIAVADHNEIINVRAVVAAGVARGLLVVPAVELSTSHGHLLCYLESVESLQTFYARIQLADRNTQTSRCQTSLFDCLNILQTLGGFAVLAHVDAGHGFETENPGNPPHKVDVLCHPALLGIELKSAGSVISYSDSDPDSNRANAGKERVKRLSLGNKQFLARVLNSDAHSLAALGRNAQGDHRVTRLKMDKPSFVALRIALQDADARVRIEDHLPSTIPQIGGVAFNGGFLDGQRIHFSPNLNCIIGGRGTGKSTTFEAIRCLTGEDSGNEVVNSDVWPEVLQLFWKDQAGQRHSLARQIFGGVANEDDPLSGPTSFHIESYGQGETAKISKEANSNPVSLLAYLDRFIDISEPSAEEQNARDELLELQTAIEDAARKVEQIPLTEKSLLGVQQQLKALERAKAKEVIVLQRRLSTEREVRSQIAEKLGKIKEGIENYSPRAVVQEIVALADPKNLTVGGEEFGSIVTDVKKFQSEAEAAQGQAKTRFEGLRKATETQLKAWKAKEDEAAQKIEEKKKELSAQKIPLDMAYIQKLANDEARLTTSLENLRAWKPELLKLRGKYSAALKRRWSARDRIGAVRDAFAKSASETLRLALSGLTVTLKFARNSHSPDAEHQITEVMGWKTTRVQRASLLVQTMTLPVLLAAIEKKDVKAITALETAEGTKLFDRSEAEQIIGALSVPPVRFALERCEIRDLPRLTVTKNVSEAGQAPKHVTRDFSKLSLGQQQSVLLALMLSSKSNAPLIIDQPEDNLDGEFIYHSLVPVLRMAKERRQIIIVTHNANIAVLGDAEQIVVLKSTNEKGSITSRGSIDDPITRDAACNILEGAVEAFQRRAKIYGVS